MASESARFQTFLDRSRDVLLTEGDCAPLWRDLELHLLSIGKRHEPPVLGLLEEGLAAMALYLVSRPRFDYFGWTVDLRDPPTKLFFAGSAGDHTVVGRAYAGGVGPPERSTFVAQTSRPFADLQTSSVDVDSRHVFDIVEEFCRKSDQQPVRFFRRSSTRAVLVACLPDADRRWFRKLDVEEVSDIVKGRGVSLISDHAVAFRCGCDGEKIAKLVVSMWRDEPEDLFRGDRSVEVECPRCGAKHVVHRDTFESLRNR